MGNLVLIFTLIIEVAFAAYCVVTHSDQKKVRSFIRIGAFCTFILLALASIIQWGFRWYFLSALLLLWAFLGTITLVRKKTDEKAYRPGHSVRRAVGTILLVTIAVVPALIFPQVKLPPATGTHPVATTTYTYIDTSRVETFSKTGANREVTVEFWYPQDESGPYPLVVFSHGTGGLKISNTSTFLNLASNGYVVCSIDHPYHAFITIDTAGHRTLIDPTYLQEYLKATSGQYDEATLFQIEQSWMRLRTADINFVLDTILRHTQDASSDKVYHLINPEKIGLMGHSLGGESSAEVVRERYANGRKDISAVINLDADLSGEYLGYKDGKLIINPQSYPVPILNIFSDVLENLMDKSPDRDETIAVKHLIATDPQAYEIHLVGTDHMSLTDLPLISPILVSIINRSVPQGGGVEVDPYSTIEKMNGLILQFFNAYLKNEGKFSAASLK